MSLRYMDILLNNSTSVDYLGMSLTVPFPEAYVIHKMVINNQRKGKQEKDRNAIINLFPYLDTERFQNIKDSLSRKEQKAVNTFIEEYLSH